jgi:transformer-2 protein
LSWSTDVLIHDPPTFRPAANAEGEQNPGNNLHVSGVSLKVTERDLDEAFSKYGKVSEARLVNLHRQKSAADSIFLLQQVLRSQVMYDPHSREPRGFAFVTMENLDAAEAAIAGMSGVELLGRTLSVQKVSL